MRIFLSAQQALRAHAVPAYAFWEYYFRHGLAEAGHEIVTAPGVDWAEGLTALDPAARARWLGQTWGRTVDFLREEHARRPVDLFLGYLFPDQVEPAALRTIRGLGIPCVNFFCDNVREFTRIPDSFAGFDLHWVPEAEARALYSRAALPWVYAPMPMWVPPELRQPAATESGGVAFIGSHDVLREDLLGEAVAAGLPLRLYGAGWRAGPATAEPPAGPPRGKLGNQLAFLRRHGLRSFAMRATYQLHRPRPREWIQRCWQPAADHADYVRITRESPVVVGITRYPGFRHPFRRPGHYSRLRDLEAPMLGACYLVEQAPGLADLYDLGTEVLTFNSAAELVAQADRLQRDPALRRSLRERGQHRALADHTIAQSLRKIAAKLGLAA
jgi:hypothetical protein